MKNLNEIRQYSVKIECNNGGGSGVLYVPEDCDNAYILTVAHIFPSQENNFLLKISFENYGQVMEYGTLNTIENSKKNYKIKFLEGYDKECTDSPNDGAIIEIPRESWMDPSKYRFIRASMQDKLLGIGYPKTGRDKYADFECWVLESPKVNGEEEEKDCRVRYSQDKYKESMSTDTTYLDGYSGMGLFLDNEEVQDLYCSALFSRDAGTAGILYVTDAVRLYELIESMKRGHSIVYPKARYIEHRDLLKYDAAYVEGDLNVILEKMYRNKDDFFRCLCGYTGVGKTYTVNLVSRYSPHCEFEYSWTKLISCLSAKNLKELQDTVYILDPLEQLLSREEREQLFYQQESDRNTARLNTEEKSILIKKIEEHSSDLKKYNIHILFIGHNFFWKDVEQQFIREGKNVLSQKLKNSVVYCAGFNIEKIRKILQERDIKCPDYFYDIPLIGRPRWLSYLIENREKLPQEGEDQYEYEFRLYHETLDWLKKIGNVRGDFEYLETLEIDEVEKELQAYLAEDVKHRGNKKQGWDSNKLSLICAFPFDETDKGFQFSDSILYAYLIAKKLYEYARDGDSENFEVNLMNALEMARNNSYLLKRIPAFIRLFIQEDRTGVGVASKIEGWLRGDYEECYTWLYDDAMVLLKSQERDSEKIYIYNIKDDRFSAYESSKEKDQKFSMDGIPREDIKKADKNILTRNHNRYL